MLLAVDVGNTDITFGLFRESELITEISSHSKSTAQLGRVWRVDLCDTAAERLLSGRCK